MKRMMNVTHEDLRSVLASAEGQAMLSRVLRESISDKNCVEVIEGKLAGYVAERKVEEVFHRYFKTRVLPVALLAITIAGYVGFEAKQQFSALRDARNQLKDLGGELQQQRLDQQKFVAQFLDSLGSLDQQSQAQALLLQGLTSSSTFASERFANLEQMTKEQRAIALEQGRRLFEAATKVLVLDRSGEELRNLNDKNTLAIQTSAGSIATLNADVSKAQAEYTALKNLDEMQRRLLSANVVEFASLRSHDKSAIMKLPKPGGGAYEVQFETPDIENSFLLTYRVDGHAYSHPIDRRAKGVWYPLTDTDRSYEFTVDQIYSTRRARDFVTIRVHGTSELLGPRP